MGRIGLSTDQKLTAIYRFFAYIICADVFDENLGLTESTLAEYLKRFVRAINERFNEEFLRSVNENDLNKLLFDN